MYGQILMHVKIQSERVEAVFEKIVSEPKILAQYAKGGAREGRA
jgi:hypothetical protein